MLEVPVSARYAGNDVDVDVDADAGAGAGVEAEIDVGDDDDDGSGHCSHVYLHDAAADVRGKADRASDHQLADSRPPLYCTPAHSTLQPTQERLCPCS